MKANLLLVALALLPLSVWAQYPEKIDTMIGFGVLKINRIDDANIPHPTSIIYLKSLSGEVVDSVYIPKGDLPLFRGQIKSRAYHPHVFVMYFDSDSLKDGQYKVYCNQEWHYINHVEGFTQYLTWEQYMLKIMFFDSPAGSKVHAKPSLNSKVLKYDYNIVFYKPLKVEGEWVYVDVLENPYIKVRQGWIRWRDGNKLLIRTFTWNY